MTHLAHFISMFAMMIIVINILFSLYISFKLPCRYADNDILKASFGRPSWVPDNSFVIDGHCHTDASWDGFLTPEQIVLWAINNGYNGIAITDHNTTKNIAAVEEAARRLAPDDFVVIPGYEFTTLFDKHLNVYGGRTFPLPFLPIYPPLFSYSLWRFLIREEKRRGCLVQYNHPGYEQTRTFSVSDCRRLGIDSFESMSMAGRDGWWNHDSNTGMAATGGSDIHDPKYTYRIYTEIFSEDKSTAGILKAIKDGQTRVHFNLVDEHMCYLKRQKILDKRCAYSIDRTRVALEHLPFTFLEYCLQKLDAHAKIRTLFYYKKK